MPKAPRAVVLLGSQRFDPSLGAAVSDLRVEGRFALITAGWQEREDEDEELAEHLGGNTVNLKLHARAEQIFRADPELHAAHRERQTLLRHRQDFYRIRLEHELEAERVIRGRQAPAAILEQETQASIESIRALDGWHLAQCALVHEEFESKWRLGERPSVARHRREIAALLEDCAAVAITGGHVATLANRLAMFDIGELVGGKVVFAWTGGAIAISERIVLFHEQPPQGPGASEILESGLGLVPGVVVMPQAEERLLLDAKDRVQMTARRFEPDLCLALPARSRVTWKKGKLTQAVGAIQLCADGEAILLSKAGRTVERASARIRATRPPPSLLLGPPRLAIDAFIHDRPDAKKVQRFLKMHKFPIVEGTSVTFVWTGHGDGVSLRHWVYGLETSNALARVEGTDLFYLTLEIPKRSRVEYKFEIHRGGTSQWIEDPLNPNRARDPFGANSVLQSDGYELPSWTNPDPIARPGVLEPFAFESKALGAVRTGKIYLPARFRRTRQYPLLVVHDGSDYINYARMKTVLDNLIEHLEIPDLIVAFTDSPDRLREYANDEAHARVLTEELAVDLAKRFPLFDRPQARCLMGASFGAVAAFSTAWRYPGFWGRLLLQSGSFAFTDIGKGNRRGPLFDRVVEFVNAYREKPSAVSERVFVSCGVYESLIYENRSMVPLLDAVGMQVRFVEARDGHNWENWRDRLREGLSWLFPGPLMFVYE